MDMQWNSALLKRCEQTCGVKGLQDANILADINQDFGRLSCGEAVSVFKVESIEQAQKFFLFAHHHALPATIRANGLSQSGQSLAPSGSVVVDISELNSDVCWEGDKLVAGCSASWKSIIETSLQRQFVPRVIPYNTSLTLGGVISVGGIGSSSCKYGVIAANVHSLKVLTPQGDILFCSQDVNPDLFHTCLSGCGLFGLILETELNVRPCKNKVRTYTLLYDDYEQWVQDQQRLTHKVDYIEAFITQEDSEQSRQAVILASMEWDEENIQLPISLLHQNKIHEQHDQTIKQYLYRHDPRIDALKTSSAWKHYHPWFECYVSLVKLLPRLSEVVQILDEDVGGIYHVFPIARRAPKYFMLPDAEDVVTFNVLVPSVSESQREAAVIAIQRVNEILLDLGGKRYVSGWFPEGGNADYWQNHYEDLYLERKQIKMSYDPNQILCSHLFPNE